MNSTPTHKPRPMVDLIVSVILPSFILMKLSGEESLGVSGGLLLALAFPFGWGVFELIKYKKFNFIALLGVISVFLTGSIGLFELDNKWLAIKEASIPAIIGIAVFISTFTPYPLVRALFFNASIMDVEMIKQKLEENHTTQVFEKRLMTATYFITGSFAFSATMNYILAKWLVTSPAGTEAFNEELGQMTLYSYPMIAIPSMIMMMAIFFYLLRSIKQATGLKLEDLIIKK
ncbi:VC0807 family protein [Marinomonas algarum]|uniref:MFS transporter n=1 Tax=Marinomonas algarum TaxID=2883105 RepID=A0A9X1LCA5_9GAMM|nr:VC0807 family protein [Marinomonas algarum]MCB5161292.1 MFS transporter [Marinomonas algarum]